MIDENCTKVTITRQRKWHRIFQCYLNKNYGDYDNHSSLQFTKENTLNPNREFKKNIGEWLIVLVSVYI